MQPLSNLFKPGAALGGPTATVGKFISPLIQNILIILAFSSFCAVILAGFNYITSNGDKAKVQQATNMLNYSLAGLALAVSAYVLTQIVFRIGGIQDIFNPGI